MSQQGNNHFRQGDQALIVGGKLVVNGGSILPSSEAQPSAIGNPAGGATQDAEARTAINGILAALRGVGIIAT